MRKGQERNTPEEKSEFEHRNGGNATVDTTAAVPQVSRFKQSWLSFSSMTSAPIQGSFRGLMSLYTHAMQKPEKGGTHAWRKMNGKKRYWEHRLVNGIGNSPGNIVVS
jgi:hypothetical protein